MSQQKIHAWAFGPTVSVEQFGPLTETIRWVSGSSGLLACVGRCPNLHSLDLDAKMSSSIPMETIVAAAQAAPTLRKIVLSSQKYLTDEAIAAIASACPLIIQWGLSDCPLLTNRSVQTVARPTLRSVAMGDCPLVTDFSALAGCSELDELDLSYCFKASAESIARAIRSAPYLTMVTLVESTGLTDEVLVAIGQSCPRLKFLHVGGGVRLTNVGVIAIARGCPLLTQLFIHEADKLTDEAFVELARGCPELNTVNVEACTGLTDKAIIALARSCPELATMYTADAGFTGKRLVELMRLHPTLTEVTDEGLEWADDKSLEIDGIIDLIDDEALAAIAAEHLDVQVVCLEASKVTNVGLAWLYGSPALNLVNLRVDDRITSGAIVDLVRCCPSLTHVYVVDGDLDEDAREEIRGIRPDIQLVVSSDE